MMIAKKCVYLHRLIQVGQTYCRKLLDLFQVDESRQLISTSDETRMAFCLYIVDIRRLTDDYRQVWVVLLSSLGLSRAYQLDR